MGKWCNFKVLYESGQLKTVRVHIKDDQDEADGFIMAARAGKAAVKSSSMHLMQFEGFEDGDESE